VTPLVTVIVPARDEARHIDACVRSILRQEVDGGLEVLVVDGASRDDTAVRARLAGATVVDNPDGTIPAGLNRGLVAARGDVIVRFDAHAEMLEGYVAACLRALEEERAANVGGWREARGTGPWGRALALALASPLGVGNAGIWRPPGYTARRDVDTVPLGCFRAPTLLAVGGWDERLLANEDFDLNHRLRLRGGRVVFDPRIASVYRPRESLDAIVRQYVRYGRWKAAMVAAAPGSVRPRQLAPPLLLATIARAVTSGPLARPARLALGVYATALVVETRRRRGGVRLPVVLAAMHAGWGAGLAAGLARIALTKAVGGALHARRTARREPHALGGSPSRR
jgi:succinoglycan biosynthesis protein ExoA